MQTSFFYRPFLSSIFMSAAHQDNCNEDSRLNPTCASYTTGYEATIDNRKGSRWDVEIDVKGQVDTGSVHENGGFSITKLLQYTGPGMLFVTYCIQVDFLKLLLLLAVVGWLM